MKLLEAYDILNKNSNRKLKPEEVSFIEEKEAKKNKGGTGLYVEHVCGIPPGPAPLDCDDGEIKSYKVEYKSRQKCIAPGELLRVTTMGAKTSAAFVNCQPFLESPLFKKLESVVLEPVYRPADVAVSSWMLHKPILLEYSNPEDKWFYDLIENCYNILQKRFNEAIREYKAGQRTERDMPKSKNGTLYLLKTEDRYTDYLIMKKHGGSVDKPICYDGITLIHGPIAFMLRTSLLKMVMEKKGFYSSGGVQ
jgi:hypothetical protein